MACLYTIGLLKRCLSAKDMFPGKQVFLNTMSLAVPDYSATEKMVRTLVFVSLGPDCHHPTPVAGRPVFLEGPDSIQKTGIEKTN